MPDVITRLLATAKGIWTGMTVVQRVEKLKLRLCRITEQHMEQAVSIIQTLDCAGQPVAGSHAGTHQQCFKQGVREKGVREMGLTGQQRIAVLLLAMGDKFTADVFKRLDRKEIADISKAIVELKPVPREVVEEVLRDFHESLVDGVDMIFGGSDILKRLLVKNLDPETAKYVMDSLGMETGPALFRGLEQVSPRLLSQILRNEHPQTLALIFGHLKPDQAASLLTSLPAGVRAEVLMRLARLETVPEEMVMEVDKVLTSQLIAMGGKEGKKVGGVQSVAEILNSVDRATEEEMLAEIEEDSAQMAEDIRNLMFVFEDCKKIDERGVRETLDTERHKG